MDLFLYLFISSISSCQLHCVSLWGIKSNTQQFGKPHKYTSLLFLFIRNRRRRSNNKQQEQIFLGYFLSFSFFFFFFLKEKACIKCYLLDIIVVVVVILLAGFLLSLYNNHMCFLCKQSQQLIYQFTKDLANNHTRIQHIATQM